MPDTRIEEAISLMTSYAERSGLTSDRPKRRYLWTDAFAVCNFLGLARATGEGRFTELALRLVDQVHHTLGKHRRDAIESGWISGLSEQEGEAHPTRGGLRIGKEFPERGAHERYDESLEWDRDGQYFHYLTRWMHALDQVTRTYQRPEFNRWARELAETAHRAFTYVPAGGGPLRMYWKMSIDLSRPLVPSMGQHDPLDGYITHVQLRATAAQLAHPVGGPSLEAETARYAAMVEGGEWATADPLGLGGLLSDAFRIEQLRRQGVPSDEHLLESLLTAALAGLQYYAESGNWRQPADYRLAFRELGLVIGLQALRLMWPAADRNSGNAPAPSAVRARLQALMQHAHLHEEIESFWRDPAHRRARTWSEHRDINDVMLATSLVPEGYLVLRSPH